MVEAAAAWFVGTFKNRPSVSDADADLFAGEVAAAKKAGAFVCEARPDAFRVVFPEQVELGEVLGGAFLGGRWRGCRGGG
jgi:hypothetical protein